MKKICILVGVLSMLLCINSFANKHKPTTNQALTQQVKYQVIVKLKSNNNSNAVLSNFFAKNNIQVQSMQPIVKNLYVVRLEPTSIQTLSKHNKLKTKQQLNKLVANLNQQPDVAYAERDYIVSIPENTAQNNDCKVASISFADQWDMRPAPMGVNVEQAWQKTKGAGVTVAVVDTGSVENHDLDHAWLPGYSFVTNSADTTDHSDSYHGTHVAGTIAAHGQISGVAPEAKIVPVQVLGSDGSGSFSDVLKGVYWAAGIPVEGAPENAHPAKVLNLSLGGGRRCDAASQDAYTQAYDKGATVVVAAGNSTDDIWYYTPASCQSVVSVASVSMEGHRAYYSNFGSPATLGSHATIAAPGGDQNVSSAQYPEGRILSTIKDGYACYQGTSMASPHVAGVAALVVSELPNATPAEVTKILEQSADAFPQGGTQYTNCTSDEYNCGVGLVDAGKAVNEAMQMKTQRG